MARETPHPPDATPDPDPDRARRKPAAVRVREQGHVYFFYRPGSAEGVVRGIDDVDRLYLVMSPRGKASYRLLVVAGRRLPSPDGDGKRMAWVLVGKVSSRAEGMEGELDPRASPGERRPAARPAGEGVYAIVRHRGHTHLAHLVELRREPGEVQRALGIGEGGCYVVAVANPRAPEPRRLGLEASGAEFPRGLKVRFRGRPFIPLDPPDFLDHEGAAILLVVTRQQALAALDLRLDPRHEAQATAAIFAELRAERSQHPTAPLFEGT